MVPNLAPFTSLKSIWPGFIEGWRQFLPSLVALHEPEWVRMSFWNKAKGLTALNDRGDKMTDNVYCVRVKNTIYPIWRRDRCHLLSRTLGCSSSSDWSLRVRFRFCFTRKVADLGIKLSIIFFGETVTKSIDHTLRLLTGKLARPWKVFTMDAFLNWKPPKCPSMRWKWKFSGLSFAVKVAADYWQGDQILVEFSLIIDCFCY